MPELPEVETVRRALSSEVCGKRVTSVRGKSVALRRPLDVEELGEILPGRRFLEPRRRGNFLLLDTDPMGSLLFHLGMSGVIQLVPAAAPLRAHTHLILELDPGRELRFVDPRRFGMAVWLEPGDEADDPSLGALGMEPLDPRLSQTLPPLIRNRRAPIKSLLLDQHLIAGIGNIYAAEALWRAGIHPRRAGNRISVARLATLAATLQEVLAEAIAEGGTTLRDFATPDGNSGYFAVSLQVYGRQGEPCVRCGAIIRAEAIGGRTTAWCPKCQR
jgi:formamidopyrimidine-DNA glycosylase